MSSLGAPLLEAAYSLINVASVTDLAPVHQHVIEDTQPPVVIIGQISLEPIGGKDGGLYLATIPYITMYRGTKGTDAAAIMDAVEAAALNGTLVATGLHPTRIQTVRRDDPVQGEDGATYEGTITAEAMVQPA